MEKVIVIVGPTGVGKTKLSIMLAKRFNGEIINADSMQIYKGLNIGTAKATVSEMDGIVHHLLDIKDVMDDYSVFDYQRDCRLAIEDIRGRGKTPIIVGGTGLYIKSALYDYKFLEMSVKDEYEGVSTEVLFDRLVSLDCKAASLIDRCNRRRVVNALNYFLSTGSSITDNVTDVLLYDALFIGLTTDRAKLYDIIDKRVDMMLEAGLVSEVKYFYDSGIRAKPLVGGIGYRELYSYFDGKISYDDAVSLIKQDSRRYAKRQYTFFNHQLPIRWFSTNYNDFNNTVWEVRKYIDNGS